MGVEALVGSGEDAGFVWGLGEDTDSASPCKQAHVHGISVISGITNELNCNLLQ